MNKIDEAKKILEALGLPKNQQNDRSALTLLALSGIKKKDKWKNAKAASMSVVGNKLNARYAGIMRFMAEYYDKHYAENSRETIRRQTLHQFVQAGIVHHNPENPNLSTNSKDNHYRLTVDALEVIQSFGSRKWKKEVGNFIENIGSLQVKYARNKERTKIPIKLASGKVLKFSPGKHNEVQIAVIKQFAPRFAPGSELLYVGDTSNKDLYVDELKLKALGFEMDQHAKLPDVVLFDPKRKWLFLIEAVTSHGPISPKRIIELENVFKKVKAGKIYISAFPDIKEFNRHTNNIAWETEIWLVDAPDHMIHFNGDKFMGPRK